MNQEFNGLGMSLGNLSRLSSARTRSLSAENPTGEKGKGGMSVEGTGAGPARELGQGWKVSPSVNIEAGETFTLADIDEPGAVQSMWFGGYVGRDFILRIYWDGQEQPSVECPLPDFFALPWVSDDQTPGTRGPLVRVNSQPVSVNPNKILWFVSSRLDLRRLVNAARVVLAAVLGDGPANLRHLACNGT